MGKWAHIFKEELEPSDRMKVEPVKLKLKEGFVNPSFFSKPFDTPFHLCKMYEKEIKRALDAGHIAPCGLELSDWSSKAFPVVKGDGTSCRILRSSIGIFKDQYGQQNQQISYSGISI